MSRNCQSCGMPIKGDVDKQGTNADGSKNSDYCVYCYQGGAFTQAEFSAADMQNFCITKMKSMGFPKPIAWLCTRNIPKLKRWAP